MTDTALVQPTDVPLPPRYLDPTTPPFQDARGVWHFFSRADVAAVLRGSSRDVSAFLPPGPRNPLFAFMWMREGAAHARLRQLVERWFTSREVRATVPMIRRIVADRLAEIVVPAGAGRSRFDLADLAYVVPLRVMCQLVGLPTVDETWLRDRHREVNRASFSAVPPQTEVSDYFLDLARRYAGAPGSLYAAVVAAHDQEIIDDEELVGCLYGLTVAGTDNTGTHLSNVLAVAAERGLLDDLRAIVAADGPDQRGLFTAVSELLRFMSPFPAKPLVLARPLTLSGQKFPPGTRAMVWLIAANRDPAVNGDNDTAADPNIIDLGRWPNRHLGLGIGQHYCLGAHLQAREVMTTVHYLLTRLPGLTAAGPNWFARDDQVTDESIIFEVSRADFTFDRDAAQVAADRDPMTPNRTGDRQLPHTGDWQLLR
jgi:cytochrome P450